MLRTNEAIPTLSPDTCMTYTGTTLLLSHISFCVVSWNSRCEKFLSDVARQFHLQLWYCLETSDRNFSNLELQETLQKEIWDKSKVVPVYAIQVLGGSVGMVSFVLKIDSRWWQVACNYCTYWLLKLRSHSFLHKPVTSLLPKSLQLFSQIYLVHWLKF
jgi:hypothetical protein